MIERRRVASRGASARLSLTSRSLQPAVLHWFAEIPRGARAGLRVLDLPAGDGVTSAPLLAAGFGVTPADLFPEYMEEANAAHGGRGVVSTFESQTGATLPRWLRAALFGDAGVDPPRPEGMRATPADMEATLPFGDGAFDIVLCVEGIEHVMDRHRTLRELRRVLKRGGRLLLTTPNLLSMRARAAYFGAGQRAFKSYIDEHTSVWGVSDDGSRTYHGHAFLVNYFQVRYSLHHCGFRIAQLRDSNWSPSSLALSVLAPVVGVGTWASQRRAVKRFEHYRREGRIPQGAAPPYREMFRHLMSPALLWNATLIVEAEAV